jgi:hypothetical protein
MIHDPYSVKLKWILNKWDGMDWVVKMVMNLQVS